MTFIEYCQTVRSKGLHMIRPRDGQLAQYSLKEPFESELQGWVWLDAVTADVVCRVYDALSPERQKKCQSLSATAIVNICWKAIDGRSVT